MWAANVRVYGAAAAPDDANIFRAFDGARQSPDRVAWTGADHHPTPSAAVLSGVTAFDPAIDPPPSDPVGASRRTWRASLLSAALIGAVACLTTGTGAIAAESPAGGRPDVFRAAAPACRTFPADNAWNQRVDTLPPHPHSAAWVRSIGEGERLRALFGADQGIAVHLVGGTTPPADVTFASADEADPGPYRLPDDAQVSGDERLVLAIDKDRCLLAELRGAERAGPSAWRATGGALFDLGANDLRPDGWGSADLAGLPVYPGLVRLAEVDAGEITHALRFTAPRIGSRHFWPARQDGPDGDDPDLPPAGTRFRLRATVNPHAFSPRARAVLIALQRYGMFLAETGPAWGLSGAPDPDWDDESLAELEEVFGASFEAVDVSSLVIDGGSGQSFPPPAPPASGPQAAARTPTASATPQPTTTPEPTASPTGTPTPEPTGTPKPTKTPRPTEVPEPTDTPVPTSTPVPTATNTLTPSPTITPTRTPTSTPTPVPTVSPSCMLRPVVLVTTEAHGSGRLKVTVESTNSAGVPDNSLQAIRIVALANASVEIGDNVIRQGGALVELDDGIEEVHFYVQRVAASQAYTVTLGLTDLCGEWQTFVGGGPALP